VIRRLATSALVALVALAGSGAQRSESATLAIIPARSIGKVTLGMSEAELRRAMGRPRAIVHRQASFGLRSVEFQYGYADYTVRLVGRPGRLRVVGVGTTLARERTRTGIGVGSRERAVLRAYPSCRCDPMRVSRVAGVVYVGVRNPRTCTLFAPSGRRTTFMIYLRPRWAWGEVITLERWQKDARVSEVSVSTAS
jgi:hypothetical protein